MPRYQPSLGQSCLCPAHSRGHVAVYLLAVCGSRALLVPWDFGLQGIWRAGLETTLIPGLGGGQVLKHFFKDCWRRSAGAHSPLPLWAPAAVAASSGGHGQAGRHHPAGSSSAMLLCLPCGVWPGILLRVCPDGLKPEFEPCTPPAEAAHCLGLGLAGRGL